jgi:hypothetical protein
MQGQYFVLLLFLQSLQHGRTNKTPLDFDHSGLHYHKILINIFLPNYKGIQIWYPWQAQLLVVSKIYHWLPLYLALAAVIFIWSNRF